MFKSYQNLTYKTKTQRKLKGAVRLNKRIVLYYKLLSLHLISQELTVFFSTKKIHEVFI